jgi:hypothetical protein
MSAAEALQAARAASVSIGIDGDDLVVEEAAAPPPPAVLDLLARHKTGIVAPRTARPCLAAFAGCASRKAEAVAALGTMGIAAAAHLPEFACAGFFAVPSVVIRSLRSRSGA